MKEFSVVIEEPAQKGLREIFEYISNTLIEPQIAKGVMLRIRKAIENLNQMPERHPYYDSEPWRSQGVRRMNIGNFSAFYTVEMESYTVHVLAVIYGRRDISRVLEENLNN